MNFLAWLLALSIIVVLMVEAVTFHKSSVCRQKAWLKSTELLTRKALSSPPENDQIWDLSCKLLVKRERAEISWQKLPYLKRHAFEIQLGSGL